MITLSVASNVTKKECNQDFSWHKFNQAIIIIKTRDAEICNSICSVAKLREVQDGHQAIFCAADSCFVGDNRYFKNFNLAP